MSAFLLKHQIVNILDFCRQCAISYKFFILLFCVYSLYLIAILAWKSVQNQILSPSGHLMTLVPEGSDSGVKNDDASILLVHSPTGDKSRPEWALPSPRGAWNSLGVLGPCSLRVASFHCLYKLGTLDFWLLGVDQTLRPGNDPFQYFYHTEKKTNSKARKWLF